MTEVVVSVALQILCNYITFPLYALVTQVRIPLSIIFDDFLHIYSLSNSSSLDHFSMSILQMGSHIKKAVSEEQTANALKKWHNAEKQRKKQRKTKQPDPSPSYSYMSGEKTPTPAASPQHLLQHHKHRSSQGQADMGSVPNSPISYHSDTKLSEIEFQSRKQHDDQAKPDDTSHNIDFSFVKS
ncbi:hypothetical protein SLE2022_122790 [Rubroshorea leprosula]